ncbi:M14 family metallopeptidase [Leptobacterium sp. I13]|uniref:M14 metallopeptidase family protein n=1 Tax=Leptobacterium meishanense TaxID=3128904 RepID=UPI0030EE3BAD
MRFIYTLVLSFFSIVSISQNIQSPSTFLGYELGTRFTRHHQVMDYYEYVAATVPEMVKLEVYGETYEGRKLMVAYVSSKANGNNLEEIRQEHLKTIKGEGSPSEAIVWLGYNVHGNESVSTEASMQTLYELISKKQAWLDNTVVIIDPCINPDGRDRYVNWYNQFKNTPYNNDPNSKEHHEGWLSGRSNHYMFDLNRDWAWVTQKESQQRLKIFNKWLPHVHVDFHEQGVDNPYYFAPAAEPLHEVITQWQRDFQVTIGKNHAKYFDANGWFYFTKEIFDLLYPSYGDTYPTYNGAIGMTYEQGGSGRAGLGVLTSYGDTLTLKDRIAHHNTTGLSTVEIASKNAEKLNDEFKKFYADKRFKYRSYVMSGNPDKINALKKLLDQHEITYGNASATTVKGYDYSIGKTGSIKTTSADLVVHTDQMKGKLVKVLFEPKTKLSDSLTYDITAWSLPYAYGLRAIASETIVNSTVLEVASTVSNKAYENAYAYVTKWNSMEDARFLAALLNKNFRVRYHEEPFSVEGERFERGSLIITRTDNKNKENFDTELVAIAYEYGRNLTATRTGFVDSGKDFGSSAVKMIPNVKAAILSGGSVSTLSFGEVWHFFEQQLGYPVAVIDTDYFDNVDLSKYEVFILPQAWRGDFFTEKRMKHIKEWVGNGGKLIAIGGAVNILTGDNGFGLKEKEQHKDEEEIMPSAYEDKERGRVKNYITGAIFKTKVDTSHPLAYGYGGNYFTLKLTSNSYEYLKEGNVVYIENKGTPIAGFAGSEAQKQVPKSLVFGAENYGRGNVVYMIDNPLFRGFWENGKLFFANALFMVNNR